MSELRLLETVHPTKEGIKDYEALLGIDDIKDALVDELALILDRDRPNGARYFGWEVTDAAALGDEIERASVIVDIEPVADVRAGPVNRQGLLVEGVENDKRDQLFGKMIRTVIVGAVRNHNRQPVGALPRFGEMVGSRFGCRIR